MVTVSLDSVPGADRDESDPAKWRYRTLAALTILLAFRIAALFFNRTDLSFDEAQYWSWAQYLDWGYFSKPPLLGWVIAATTGLCGDTEACVRLSSPILYWGSGIFIFLAASSLYDARTGFWSALVLATLPALSVSAAIASTDVPMIFFWCAALYAWVRFARSRHWAAGLALGIAIGLGLNSKYAMAYFPLCIAVHLALERENRWVLRDIRALAVIVPALALIVPNVLWNIDNGYVTFAHTADNADWRGPQLHLLGALNFLLEQFGVFGPVLFATLLIAAWRGARGKLDRRAAMLLHFSAPVIALILVQALISHAHANWAAAAYPAAAILATRLLLEARSRAPFRASLALHLATVGSVAVLNWAAPALALPGGINPYKQVLGWRAAAEVVRKRFDEGSYVGIVSTHRWLSGELGYYLREEGIKVEAFLMDDAPSDHFEMTRPFSGAPPGRYLVVALDLATEKVDVWALHGLERVFEPVKVPSGGTSVRTIQMSVIDTTPSATGAP